LTAGIRRDISDAATRWRIDDSSVVSARVSGAAGGAQLDGHHLPLGSASGRCFAAASRLAANGSVFE
jgi:hypothetical protein